MCTFSEKAVLKGWGGGVVRIKYDVLKMNISYSFRMKLSEKCMPDSELEIKK